MLFGRSQYSATCQQLVFPTCGHSRRWRESLTAPEHSLDLCLVPVMLVYVCRSILELSWSLWQGHVWALWKHCSAMTSLVSTRISLWLLPPIHTEKRSSCYSLCKFPAHLTTIDCDEPEQVFGKLICFTVFFVLNWLGESSWMTRFLMVLLLVHWTLEKLMNIMMNIWRKHWHVMKWWYPCWGFFLFLLDYWFHLRGMVWKGTCQSDSGWNRWY